mmetsp:Transcript_33266/g.93276  ORF Transcript_33266/g.93276 Transcript_33266/m.93276 type:complete len:113 (-) Transcript_33266:1182-1520(-)
MIGHLLDMHAKRRLFHAPFFVSHNRDEMMGRVLFLLVNKEHDILRHDFAELLHALTSATPAYLVERVIPAFFSTIPPATLERVRGNRGGDLPSLKLYLDDLIDAQPFLGNTF